MFNKLLSLNTIFNRFLKFGIKEKLAKSSVMPLVSVRSVNDDERLQISFKFPPETVGVDKKQRIFNFSRPKSEELEKTLARIATSVSTKVVNKKAKKKKIEDAIDEQEVNVSLLEEDLPVNPLIVNENAWKNGFFLAIGDIRYTVRLNVPTIKSLTLPEMCMLGFPIFPKIVTEFANESHFSFTWYKEKRNSKHNEDDKGSFESECSKELEDTVGESKRVKILSQNIKHIVWDGIHCGKIYTPSSGDLGSLLKVECSPRDIEQNGEIVSSISKTVVIPGPGVCPFEKRHQFTSHLSQTGCFRFISYNLLADLYADSDFSRDFLFPHCPPNFLNIDYRKQLILKELLGYNADIICLQEVDKKIFDHDLKPALSDAGLTGMQKLKGGEVSEGCATFFRHSKFRLVAQQDILLIEVLENDPIYEDIFKRISKSEPLKKCVMERSSVLQTTLLQFLDDPSKHLLVNTIHLYFHPRASNIRILQTAVCLRHIERVLSNLESEGIRPAVVFCGDLNSQPESGLHEFLCNKTILGKHADWFSGGKEQFVDGMDLDHGLDLSNACGYPRYTNYVPGFSSSLDYIYIEKTQLKTVGVIPMPSHADVTQHTALPNVVFPSDHIAIGCDITWTV